MNCAFPRRDFLAGIGVVLGAGFFSEPGRITASARRADPQPLEGLSDWLKAPLSAREATVQACVDRIHRMDASIQAWVQVSPQKPIGKGPLSGIPVGVKDVYETRGLATEYGSPIYKGRVGTADAALVRELRDRGAIIMGKTHTAAFAFRDPPPTRNPRNLDHTPGGSSSGSAAAVAAGMVPFATGTQTKGSTLRPASYCGITGFKPTFGAFSTEGILPFASSLDTVGFFTHTPSDMLELWRALGRPIAHDEPFTVGIPEPFPDVEPEMVQACQRAISSLRNAGIAARTIDISGWLVRLDAAQQTIMYYEGARFHQQRFAEYGDRLGALATLVREGLQMPDSTYAAATRLVADARERFVEMYRTTPIMLVPAATGPAPTGISSTGDGRMNSACTALGTPAISVPMPVGSSLPLGLQLTAALGDDAKLLRAAIRVHAALTPRA
jgi:Asp-tRNA(Asn)/Glu-tRNA(Gln) amidotransferase A subunit family amidase